MGVSDVFKALHLPPPLHRVARSDWVHWKDLTRWYRSNSFLVDFPGLSRLTSGSFGLLHATRHVDSLQRRPLQLLLVVGVQFKWCT